MNTVVSLFGRIPYFDVLLNGISGEGIALEVYERIVRKRIQECLKQILSLPFPYKGYKDRTAE
jgi:hypothetical protein